MPLDSLGAGIPTDHVAPRVEHEDRVIRDRIDEKMKSTFSLFQLGSGRGKLTGAIGDTGFEALIESQESGFQNLALADLVIDTGHTSSPTGLILRDLALPGDPMDTAVKMRDPKLDVIGTPSTRN